jgi:nucleotide-binding universal stress UspA family protein
MFKRIFLPIDGSALSLSAANASVLLAQAEGAEVFGFVVIPPYWIPAFLPK